MNLFKKNEIIHWIDSGTLLGLYRDGELITGDKDVDISVLINYTNQENHILSFVKQCGYTDVRVRMKFGKIFKIKVFVYDDRTIDISFFFDSGKNFLISPQIDINQSHLLLRSSIVKKILISYLYRSKSIDYSKLLFLKLVYVGYWLAPKNLIQPDNLGELSGLTVPKNIDDYLPYRYGTWKEKVSKWSSKQQDGGLYFLDIL